MRIGIGFDIHRLADGRPFILAGVKIPSARGPLGHSDGDALCHALADALLGAAACGDIGEHFPDTDRKWKDAPGLKILADTLKIIKRKKLTVQQIDSIVVCQKPILSPFRDAIRRNLGKTIGISPELIGLKFKTAEGMGDIGRSKALSAWAAVILGKVK